MACSKIRVIRLLIIIAFAFNLGHGMKNSEYAIVGGGCFWCIEAVYQRIDGIISVIPGYAGGKSKNTTYKEVCTGTTGHAEVAKIEFDSDVITFKQILKD